MPPSHVQPPSTATARSGRFESLRRRASGFFRTPKHTNSGLSGQSGLDRDNSGSGISFESAVASSAATSYGSSDDGNNGQDRAYTRPNGGHLSVSSRTSESDERGDSPVGDYSYSPGSPGSISSVTRSASEYVNTLRDNITCRKSIDSNYSQVVESVRLAKAFDVLRPRPSHQSVDRLSDSANIGNISSSDAFDSDAGRGDCHSDSVSDVDSGIGMAYTLADSKEFLNADGSISEQAPAHSRAQAPEQQQIFLRLSDCSPIPELPEEEEDGRSVSVRPMHSSDTYSLQNSLSSMTPARKTAESRTTGPARRRRRAARGKDESAGARAVDELVRSRKKYFVEAHLRGGGSSVGESAESLPESASAAPASLDARVNDQRTDSPTSRSSEMHSLFSIVRNFATRNKRDTSSDHVPDHAQAASTVSVETCSVASARRPAERIEVPRPEGSCTTIILSNPDLGVLPESEVDFGSDVSSEHSGNTMTFDAGIPTKMVTSSKAHSVFASTARALRTLARREKKAEAPAPGLRRRTFTGSARFEDDPTAMLEWRNNVQCSTGDYIPPLDGRSIDDGWSSGSRPLSTTGTGSATGPLSASDFNMSVDNHDDLIAERKRVRALRPGEPGWLSAQDEQRRRARRSFDRSIAVQREGVEKLLSGNQSQERVAVSTTHGQGGGDLSWLSQSGYL